MKRFMLALLVSVSTLLGSNTNSLHKYRKFILKAEATAAPQARKVMKTTRSMVQNRVVVRGACWDYLNAAFTKAGYPQSKISKIFKGSKRGPFASIDIIRAGDWLYFINHSFHNIEHSGMFINWINKARKQALILSYAGQNRSEPARYRVYDLSHVYYIMRAK